MSVTIKVGIDVIYFVMPFVYTGRKAYKIKTIKQLEQYESK